MTDKDVTIEELEETVSKRLFLAKTASFTGGSDAGLEIDQVAASSLL